jgi:hypothetical protein
MGLEETAKHRNQYLLFTHRLITFLWPFFEDECLGIRSDKNESIVPRLLGSQHYSLTTRTVRVHDGAAM